MNFSYLKLLEKI